MEIEFMLLLAKTCQKVTSSQIVNGAVIGDKFFYPEIIHFICQEGHTLEGGGSKWQCNYNGNWKDMKNNSLIEFPNCERRIRGECFSALQEIFPSLHYFQS